MIATLQIEVDTGSVQAQLRELLEALDPLEGLSNLALDGILGRLDSLLSDHAVFALRPAPGTGNNVLVLEVGFGRIAELIAAARGAAQGDFVGHGGLHAK